MKTRGRKPAAAQIDVDKEEENKASRLEGHSREDRQLSHTHKRRRRHTKEHASSVAKGGFEAVSDAAAHIGSPGLPVTTKDGDSCCCQLPRKPRRRPAQQSDRPSYLSASIDAASSEAIAEEHEEKEKETGHGDQEEEKQVRGMGRSLESERGFDRFLLDSRILKAVSHRLRLAHPTAVQVEAIPLLLQGKDAFVRARTGSGKTLAYAIPTAQRLLETLRQQPNGFSQELLGAWNASSRDGGREALFLNSAHQNPIPLRALVIVPTRELCRQVNEVFTELLHYCHDEVSVAHTADYNCASLPSSGQHASAVRSAPSRQLSLFSDISALPNILVGTPRALLEISALHADGEASFHTRESCRFLDLRRCIETVVVDEADLMFSFGFEQDMRRLAERLPRHAEGSYQATLWSATLNEEVAGLQVLMLHKPVTISIPDEAEKTGSRLVEYCMCCPDKDKWLVAYAIIKLHLMPMKCLVFTSTPHKAYAFHLFLHRFGISSGVLSPTVPYTSRYCIVQSFNQGLFDILIAPEGGDDTPDERTRQLREETKRTQNTSKTGREAEDVETTEDAEEFNCEDSDKEGSGEEENNVAEGAVDANQRVSGKTRRHTGEDSYSMGTAADCFGVHRGLDFQNVASVLNLDTPLSVTAYIHRVGRTARAGAAGVALTLAASDSLKESAMLQTIKLALEKENCSEKEGLRQLQLSMSDVECFRYRVEDVARSVTSKAVVAIRARELQREALHNEKLANYFSEHPTDHIMLKKAARQIKEHHIVRPHLKHLPAYLISTAVHAVRQLTPVELAIESQRATTECEINLMESKGKSQERSKLNADLFKNFDLQPSAKQRRSLLRRAAGSRRAAEPDHSITAPEELPPISGRKLWRLSHGKQVRRAGFEQLHEDPLKRKQRWQKRISAAVAKRKAKK